MPRINLLRKVEIDGKWLTLPVARHKTAGGHVSYDFTRVLNRKVPTVVLSGTFYLEYREDGRKMRRAVGSDVRDVKAALATQTGVLALRRIGGEAEDAPQIQRSTPGGRTIREIVERFKSRPPLEYRPNSIAKYRNALEDFLLYCCGRSTHVSQLDREDIKGYMTWLVRSAGLEPRTAHGKAVAVLKVMRDAGGAIVMRRGDWPRYTEPQPEVYQPEVLHRLFAAASQDEYECYQTFLHTGLREQELVYLGWADFDHRRSLIHVRKKTGFDPKTYQERSVPIPRSLVALLQERKRRHTDEGREDELIFATEAFNTAKGQTGSQPDQKLLRKLKSLAYRAYLNCGYCVGQYRGKPDTCARAPICRQFGLHKFRHTYATTMLREGIDLRSLQMLLGHNELASTEKYLRALEPEKLVERINRTEHSTRFTRQVEPGEVMKGTPRRVRPREKEPTERPGVDLAQVGKIPAQNRGTAGAPPVPAKA